MRTIWSIVSSFIGLCVFLWFLSKMGISVDLNEALSGVGDQMRAVFTAIRNAM